MTVIDIEENGLPNGVVEVTLRGGVEQIMELLIKGLTPEALAQFSEALTSEIAKRPKSGSQG